MENEEHITRDDGQVVTNLTEAVGNGGDTTETDSPSDDDGQRAEGEADSLRAAIREQAREDESPNAATFTLREILGGDFLTVAMIRRHLILILVVVAFCVVYVANRYGCQNDMIEIDRLERALTDARYKALSTSSELTELCRESNVLKRLRQSKDSMLTEPDQPPYIIKTDKE